MLRTENDLAAMEQVLVEALERVPTRLLSYCLMGSHALLSLPKGGIWCSGREMTVSYRDS